MSPFAPFQRIEPPPPGLVRMRLVAAGLLVLMAALFLVARAFAGRHPALGYLQAFAEAAMVGGLADWFAVTALFRHPLGLPIPHTAIVPRNKDRIGDTLAAFLRANFLTPPVVARRMRRVDAAMRGEQEQRGDEHPQPDQRKQVVDERGEARPERCGFRVHAQAGKDDAI